MLEGELKPVTWIRQNPILALNIAANLAKRRLGLNRKDRQSDESSSQESSYRKEMLEAIQAIEKEVGITRALPGIQAWMDWKFYAADYLSGEPYIRLSLRSFSGKNDPLESETLEVFLILHRAGVAIITFIAPVQDSTDTDDLILVESSEGIKLAETTICDDLWRNARPHPGSYKSHMVTDELSEGARWRTTVWSEPISLSYVFSLYQERVISAAGKRWTPEQEEWFCYTSIIVGSLDCCKTQPRWMKRHKNELTGIIGRVGGYQGLSKSFIDSMIDRDRSITTSASSYYLASNSVYIEWNFDVDEGTRHPAPEDALWFVLIENFLLQYWQIRNLDALISKTPQVEPKNSSQIAA